MFFVGIGAQRAATTWLWQLLRRHPEVAKSPIKELHYFSGKHLPNASPDRRAIAKRRLAKLLLRPNLQQREDLLTVRLLTHWLTMDEDEDYVSFFRELANLTGKTTFGEMTTTYALLPEAGFKHIAQTFEDVRFLLLMRNPAERMWSNFQLRVANGAIADLDENALAMVREPQARSRTDYAATTDRVIRAVGRERLFVAFTEDITAPEEGAQVRAALLRFLGLSPFEFPADDVRRRANESRGRELPETLRTELATPFRPTYEFAQSFMGHLPDDWARDLRAVDESQAGDAMDDELRGEWS